LTIQIPNNKKVFLLIYGILFYGVLFSQEQIIFVAERNTIAYRDRDKSELKILAGELITTNAEVLFGYTTIQTASDWGESIHHLVIYFGDSCNSYKVFAKDFRPVNTDNIFSENVFINHPFEYFEPGFGTTTGDVNAMWVPYYYIDILQSQTRDKLLEIHPWLVELSDHGIFWYERAPANIRLGRAMFYNSVIMLGEGRHFAVKNINVTDYGYIVNCVMSTLDGRGSEWSETLGTKFWDTYWPGVALTLFMHIDGDYLDIYAEGNNIHVGTYIKVGREFIKQYQSLIKTNTCDLTNVIWPQRAEGSTGKPPDFSVFINNELDILEENDSKRDMPLWLLFVIIGGTVFVAIGVMLLIVKRRK